MVQAIIDIPQDTNVVLNIIKAKYSLKDKSEAIVKMAEEYKSQILEPEYKPEFIEKMNQISKEKSIKVDNFKERYGLSD